MIDAAADIEPGFLGHEQDAAAARAIGPSETSRFKSWRFKPWRFKSWRFELGAFEAWCFGPRTFKAAGKAAGSSQAFGRSTPGRKGETGGFDGHRRFSSTPSSHP